MQITNNNQISKSMVSNQAKNMDVNETPKGKKVPTNSKQDEANLSAGLDSFVKAPETTSVTYTRETMTVDVVASEEAVNATETSTASDSAVDATEKGLSAKELATLSDERVSSFKNMIMQLVGEQLGSEVFSSSLYSDLVVSEEVALEAQEAIGEGGYWSAEEVSGRIIDMAKALSGGDASKLELLKEAVIQGFDNAAEIWGEEMPDITSQTYDLVMQGFDDWAAEATASSQIA